MYVLVYTYRCICIALRIVIKKCVGELVNDRESKNCFSLSLNDCMYVCMYVCMYASVANTRNFTNVTTCNTNTNTFSIIDVRVFSTRIIIIFDQ